MTSKTLSQMLADLGVEKTHARPHVSDDNPFSESQFKTLKCSPRFPDRFGSPEHARDVSRGIIRWYNHEHHHSALCHLTPAVVHYGRADLVLAERHRVRLGAYHDHPERFVNGPPRLQRLPGAVWINPPEKATRQDAPGSTQPDPDDLRVVPSINTYGLPTRSGARRPLDEREQAALQMRPGPVSRSSTRSAAPPTWRVKNGVRWIWRCSRTLSAGCTQAEMAEGGPVYSGVRDVDRVLIHSGRYGAAHD